MHNLTFIGDLRDLKRLAVFSTPTLSSTLSASPNIFDMSPTNSMVIDYAEPNYKDSAKQFTRKLPSYTKEYFVSMFPIFTWIHRYNLTVCMVKIDNLGQIFLKFANFGLLQWLMSDIIAGVTVGIVVVPQGMGYAKIAQLPAVNYQTSFS